MIPGSNGFRALAEKASKGFVLRRRLPAEFGGQRIYVSPGAGGLRYWRTDLSKVDPDLLRLVARLVKPGMSVWDVGANVGLFTFAAAFKTSNSGAVLAVEADADNVNLLLRTARAGDQARVAPVQVLSAAVAGPGSRVRRLNIASRARSSNFLAGHGASQTGGVQESRVVVSVTLDELLQEFAEPSLVKIDVEGAELEVLRGATTLLQRIRPTIVVEVSTENADGVTQLLRSFGYALYDGAQEPRQWSPVSVATWNTVAIPEGEHK